jgi:hypothetical protein
MKTLVVTSFSLPFLAIGIVSAAEPQLPPLKEGLWESHTQQVIQKSKTEMVIKLCRTHEFDKVRKASANSAGETLRKLNGCTDVVTRQSAGSYSSEMHCDKDGTLTKMTMTYQGDTSYHMEMRARVGQSESVTVIDDRYIGPCPADMKPGDAVMADGKRFNFSSP